MIVRMLGRFTKEKNDKLSQDIEEELDTQEIIGGDDFNREEARTKLIRKHNAFDYTPLTFNLKDVMMYNLVDRYHTNVKFYGSPSFTFKITEEQFAYVYQMFLGINIMDFTKGTVMIGDSVYNNDNKTIDDEL